MAKNSPSYSINNTFYNGVYSLESPNVFGLDVKKDEKLRRFSSSFTLTNGFLFGFWCVYTI